MHNYGFVQRLVLTSCVSHMTWPQAEHFTITILVLWNWTRVQIRLRNQGTLNTFSLTTCEL